MLRRNVMRSEAWRLLDQHSKDGSLYFYLHTRALLLLPGMNDRPIEEMENGSASLILLVQFNYNMKCAVRFAKVLILT